MHRAAGEAGTARYTFAVLSALLSVMSGAKDGGFDFTHHRGTSAADNGSTTWTRETAGLAGKKQKIISGFPLFYSVRRSSNKPCIPFANSEPEKKMQYVARNACLH